MSQDHPLSSLLRQSQGMSGLEPAQVADNIVQSIYQAAQEIAGETVQTPSSKIQNLDRRLDNIFLSRLWGYPVMLILLTIILWITISGANYPSSLLASGLFWLEERLTQGLQFLNAAAWINGFFIEGVYRSVAWVISVMLPPMAIFFPLFTLLEDAGYLPRVAFNLDYFFKKAGAHGKQALTMCMGFGCNAAGIVSCRIIDSPRERLIAALTNNFTPCNGRFPTLIAMATLFIGGSTLLLGTQLMATLTVAGFIMVGIILTFILSYFLSRTLLKGEASSFTLELPPYRPPRIGQVIIRSVMDRTLFVLGRAVIVAAPAGAITWVLANTYIGGTSLLASFAAFLHPFAIHMGLDGFILMAFILGLPANEIVLPILIMAYVSGGSMIELQSLGDLRQLFIVEHGWTWLTGICFMLFTLCHWPCGTTLYTLQKEQKNVYWTFMAFLLPTCTGILLCISVNYLVQFMNLL